MSLKHLVTIAVLFLSPLAFANESADHFMTGAWIVEADYACSGNPDWRNYRLDVSAKGDCWWTRPDNHHVSCRISGSGKNFAVRFVFETGEINGRLSASGRRFDGSYYAPGYKHICVNGKKR